MTDEVLGTRLETELVVNSLHGILVEIQAWIKRPALIMPSAMHSSTVPW